MLVRIAVVRNECSVGGDEAPEFSNRRSLIDAAAEPAHAVCLAANHETVEVKVAPIECDLEQVVQGGDAGVAVGAARRAGSLTGSAHHRPLPISRILLGVRGAASEKVLLKKLLLVRLERF